MFIWLYGSSNIERNCASGLPEFVAKIDLQEKIGDV